MYTQNADPDEDSVDHSIRLLSAETRAKLRSTQILTSLPQIVSELMQNALDAGANQIDIGVNCEEWLCWVRDNGIGMSKEGMALLAEGSEKGRYSTSKAYEPNSACDVSTFGFRGEALASAADLCCLEISSRTVNSKESWSVILQGGKTLYNGPSIRWRRESAGTVVCIRDAFYNLPVRRLSHPPLPKTMETIRQEIEIYALVSRNVAFSLENLSNKREGSSFKDKVIRIPKIPTSLSTFRHLFGRALVEHADEISSTSGDMRIEGFISTHGAYSKLYQFLCSSSDFRAFSVAHQFKDINSHPMNYCDLHRVIDMRFAASSFGKLAFTESGDHDLEPGTRRSPRKSEKKPIYVINLCIPPRLIDNCLEPAKTTVQFENKNVVLAFLSSEVQSFLLRHGFANQNQIERKARQDIPPSFGKKRKVEREECFGIQDDVGVVAPQDLPPPPVIHPDNDPTEHEQVIWTDPSTGEKFVVDMRTGNSYSQSRCPEGVVRDDLRETRRTILPRVGQPDLRESASIPDWIKTALASNNVYSFTEKRIPALHSSALENAHQSQRYHDCRGPFLSQMQNAISSESISRKFHRGDLLGARVISQVDQKFIACLIGKKAGWGKPDQPGNGQTLVLIDQHAADERVRVEGFLRELCVGFLQHRELGDKVVEGVRARTLSPPVLVLLTSHEAFQLVRCESIRDAFRRWGFVIGDLSSVDDSPSSETSNGMTDADPERAYVQVPVYSIPDVVGDKLLQGDELPSLIKGFLGKLESDLLFTPGCPERDDLGPQSANCDDENFSWLKALRWCPRELLDLVNSKACRGAVMFNDTLSMGQCERLVRQLSQTAFPFQCAHGRPSLVPLSDVDNYPRDPGRRDGSHLEWSKLE